MTDFDDEMGGRKIPSFFDQYSRPGEKHGGPLKTKPAVRNVTDFKTGQIKTFADGSAMTQYVLDIETDEREAAVEGDDGTRRLYVKGRNKKRLKDAIREAGLKTLSPGDVVIDTYVRQDDETKEKIHTYKVKPGPGAQSAGVTSEAPRDSKSKEDDEPPF